MRAIRLLATGPAGGKAVQSWRPEIGIAGGALGKAFLVYDASKAMFEDVFG